ncbi:MAG: molybdopterin dinucleotide binding domain-containing protein [Euryarchaeota archaeon]|nr:molybdopterin dinucleotide binding domain-containing protein [Euryarchaeota archaeon]
MMEMEFGEFLAAPECKVVIVMYPDLFRTEAWLRHGKFSSEYQELSAVIVLDPVDMAKIEVKDSDLVEVLGEEGAVVVRVKESEKEHPGIGYMPEGAWANVLGAGPASAKVRRSQQEIPAIEEVYRR